MEGGRWRDTSKRATALTEQQMARYGLEALRAARSFDVEVRCIYIQALIKDGLLPGAVAEDAEPDRFETLIEMMASKASPESTPQDH